MWSENSFWKCFLKECHLVKYFSPNIKHKDKYTLACVCVHAYTYACMQMCTFLPNMLNIPQSERLWKQQKHISKLLDNLPHEKLSSMILSWFLFPATVFALSVTFWWSFYNNNRLFMVSHLVRAQSTYKDIRVHSFHHRHTHAHTHTTNTCITGEGLVKQHQYAEEKRWVFIIFFITSIIIFPVVRILMKRWEFEMTGTVVQHEANQDNLACLLWLKMQTTAEAVPPLFCHTNASLHSCTCRTVGKVVSPLWPSCWTLYRCHEPGSYHIYPLAKESIQGRPVAFKGSKQDNSSRFWHCALTQAILPQHW